MSPFCNAAESQAGWEIRSVGDIAGHLGFRLSVPGEWSNLDLIVEPGREADALDAFLAGRNHAFFDAVDGVKTLVVFSDGTESSASVMDLRSTTQSSDHPLSKQLDNPDVLPFLEDEGILNSHTAPLVPNNAERRLTLEGFEEWVAPIDSGENRILDYGFEKVTRETSDGIEERLNVRTETSEGISPYGNLITSATADGIQERVLSVGSSSESFEIEAMVSMTGDGIEERLPISRR